MLTNKEIFESYLYKRLEKYLEEIRHTELVNLGMDYEDYENERYDTDISSIINLVEEALMEVPEEDWRF